LQFAEEVIRHTIEETVAVVKSRGHQRHHQSFSGFLCQTPTNVGYVMELRVHLVLQQASARTKLVDNSLDNKAG
jgi:hypothetical protein